MINNRCFLVRLFFFLMPMISTTAWGQNLIKGTLEAFWETGTEGMIWSVETVPNSSSPETLYFLKKGDYLKIMDPEDSQVVWEGVIDPDYETDYQPYSLNPSCGQPAAVFTSELDGEDALFWVHWIQKGVRSATWASYFIKGLPALVESPTSAPSSN